MPARYFGYACVNMTLGEVKPASKRVFTDRTLRMDGFSLRRASELALKNAKDLVRVMEWNAEHGIRFFRVGSGIFPFMDHPTLGMKFPLSTITKPLPPSWDEQVRLRGIMGYGSPLTLDPILALPHLFLMWFRSPSSAC